MQPFHESAGFQDLSITLEEAKSLLVSGQSSTLAVRNSLPSVIAAAHLESALLDAGIPYVRRIIGPGDAIPVSPAILIDADGTGFGLKQGRLEIGNMEMEFAVGETGNRKMGRLEVVGCTAILAGFIAPGGERVTRLRPWSLAGAWLSESLDRGHCPQYMIMKQHMLDQGVIRSVPLVEVEDCSIEMLHGLPERMLSRMRRRWKDMDLETRSSAMSDLMLPVLQLSNSSTARLEELGWNRILGPGWQKDLATMMVEMEKEWTGDPSTSSRIMDSLISSGLI